MNSPKTPSYPETSGDVVRVEEPTPPGEPGLLTFPTEGRCKSWSLTETLLAEWREAYPHLDVIAECKKALAWLHADPGRRKTAKGMPRFLVGWLGRAQDRGAGRTVAPRPAPPTFEDLFRKAKEGKQP